MTVNETLKNKRIEMGLSQTAVAKYLKIPQSSLCRYEQGVKQGSNELITHKLVNFYKEEYKNLKPMDNDYVQRQKTLKENKKKKESSFSVRLDKIYNEELKKLTKNIEQKAMKRALKKILKEL